MATITALVDRMCSGHNRRKRMKQKQSEYGYILDVKNRVVDVDLVVGLAQPKIGAFLFSKQLRLVLLALHIITNVSFCAN
jgi:hypothetical protein